MFLFPLVAFGLSLALLTGCGKTPTQDSKSPAQPSTINHQPSTASVLRFHWLGKQRLAADPGDTNFMAIWNLPESARLEAQTLDKLATAPWRLWQTNVAVSNAPTALLRPLLDDLVQAESYLEGWGDPNHPGEFVFAIRLPAARAALWETNLPVILTSLAPTSAPASSAESLTGARPTTSDFRLQTSDFTLTLSRSNDWTLVAFSPPSPLRGEGRGENSPKRNFASWPPEPTPNPSEEGSTTAGASGHAPLLGGAGGGSVHGQVQSTNPSQPSTLLDAFRSRIATTGIPFVSSAVNEWLELSIDFRQLNDTFKLDWIFTPDLPRLTLGFAGAGANVRTVGELAFPRQIPVKLELWQIPTNLIHDPLLSFTAIRGVAHWLGSWSAWQVKDLGAAPNQVFFWAQAPALWQHFVTYPVGNGSNHVSALSDYVLRDLNPIFLTNKVGKFEWETNTQRLVWKGVPFFQPVLERATFNQTDFAVFGLFANNATNRPVPAGLFAEFNQKPNLLYFDWEITGPQVTSWTQMGQLIRMVFGRVQLSPRMASLPWLRAMTPMLGNATTVMMLESPDRISLKRSSTCGLTAVELHLLAEWLESPQFPVGLHTLLASRPARVPLASTNAPAR